MCPRFGVSLRGFKKESKMSKKSVISAVLLCALAWSAWATNPALGAEESAKKARVYVPYSKLELTPDQQKEIGRIQREIRDRIKALMAEEAEKVAGLLTDDQKAHLKKMDEEKKQKSREYGKKYREKKKAEAESEAKAQAAP